MEKHKVFISYHHDNDQWAKEKLLTINKRLGLFIDMSVGTGDIDEDLPSQEIREEIRDNYLKDTSVLILLVGSETKNRKHIDWEIYSSMYNGKVNKQSGILVITLPESGMNRTHAGHGSEEKEKIHTDISSWVNATESYGEVFANMPARILANLRNPEAYISVIPWDKIVDNPAKLYALIDCAFHDRAKNKYDLSLPMMSKNR